MISSGELRLLLAVMVVVVAGVGIGVILDHYGTPTVVYVHSQAPQCPSPVPSPMQPSPRGRQLPNASASPIPRPLHNMEDPGQAERNKQVFVDLIAHDAMQVLQRVAFIGTSDGRTAMSLARAASYRCQLVAFDEEERRLEDVVEEWNTLGRAAIASFLPIIGSGRAVTDQILAKDKRGPALVVSNWEEGEQAFAEEVLAGIAPHLPDGSVVVVPQRVWEKFSSGKLKHEVEGEEGVAVSMGLFERFERPRLEMGVDLVAILVERDELPHFDRTLLPPWTGLGQVALPELQSYNMEEWIVFARLQKTASKTIEGYLQSHTRHTRCGRRFLVSPSFENHYCASNELCSTENFASVMESQNGYCHVMSGHHCDWDDMLKGLFEYDPAEMRMVTGVRDPARRVKSEFKHVHGSHLKAWDYCPSAEGGPQDKFSKETFIKFLQNEQNAWGMTNRQTRMLAGCGTMERCTLSDEQLLERAKQHVLQTHVLTIAERMSESVLLTAYAFGWNVEEFGIVSDSRVMSETMDWNLDESVTALIEERNSQDFLLVDFCHAVMDARIEEFRTIVEAVDLPSLVCSEDRCHLEGADLIRWDAFVPE